MHILLNLGNELSEFDFCCLLSNGKPCFTATPVLLLLLLLLLKDALVNAWIMCPPHTRQLCEACWLMPTTALGKILRTFLFCLYKVVCVSGDEGDYSKAIIVSLAWVLAEAEKLPQASLQEEYFIALESCLFCHAGWSWNKHREMLQKKNNIENANLIFILFPTFPMLLGSIIMCGVSICHGLFCDFFQYKKGFLNISFCQSLKIIFHLIINTIYWKIDSYI